MPGMTRRSFLQGSALLPTFPTLDHLSRLLKIEDPFLIGVNHPWIAYGHDFGENAWGHDGIITSGWTAQKFEGSQGFLDARLSSERSRGSGKSIRIEAALVEGHADRSKGEVYLDLRNHPPRGVTAPVDLTGVTASCWLWLPEGSAGPAHAPNGLQIFFKSLDPEDPNNPDAPEVFSSWYSPWINLETRFEEEWTRFTVDLAGPAGFQDERFDPARVVIAGVKIGTNPGSAATLSGVLYLTDFVINTAPPIVFDFNTLEMERDLAVLRRVLRQCPRRVVRIFVFADGRAAPNFNARGEVVGFDRTFFEDFDELLRIAQRQGILLLPVLLDFHWLDTPRIVSGVQVGGRASVIRDPALRRTFLRRALAPLAERYADHPNILAWEVINEPEWAMQEVVKDYEIGDPVHVDEMVDFVRRCVQILHARTSHPVTVGSARRKWLPYWQDCRLDLYQFHWYDKFAIEEPFPWAPYAELGLDKPCLIGEVATASTGYTAEEYLHAACAGGYHGLLLWSYRAGDEFSSFARARPGLARWCATSPGC